MATLNMITICVVSLPGSHIRHVPWLQDHNFLEMVILSIVSPEILTPSNQYISESAFAETAFNIFNYCIHQNTFSSGKQEESVNTYVRDIVMWNLCLRPWNITKDFGGKDRAVTSQYGFSNPPEGQLHLKPPSGRFMQDPPFLHTPGEQRPDRMSTSQWSPNQD